MSVFGILESERQDLSNEDFLISSKTKFLPR